MSPSDPGSLSFGRPPVKWLSIGYAAAVIGLVVVVVLGAKPLLAIIGWVLVGPLAILLIAAYLTLDAKAKSASIYSAPPWATWAYRGLVVLCLVGAAAAAVRIGLWIGRW